MNNTPPSWKIPQNYIPYKDRTKEGQQDYWNNRFFQRRRKDFNTFPLDIINFKEENKWLEPDFNRFLPWIIDALMGVCFEYIEDIFILDDKAKKYLYDNARKVLEQYGKHDIESYNVTVIENEQMNTQSTVKTLLKENTDIPNSLWKRITILGNTFRINKKENSE